MTDDPIARLRRMAKAMINGQPLAADDTELLADAFHAASRGEVSLDEAFGLERRSQPSPLSQRALQQRSVLIHRLAAHYRGSASGCAKMMAADGIRYASTCWPRLRNATAPPAYHLGRAEETLFRLHHCAEEGGARWPLSWRSILQSLQSGAVATAKVSAAESSQ